MTPYVGLGGAAVGHRRSARAGARLLPERDPSHDRARLHQRRQRRRCGCGRLRPGTAANRWTQRSCLATSPAASCTSRSCCPFQQVPDGARKLAAHARLRDLPGGGHRPGAPGLAGARAFRVPAHHRGRGSAEYCRRAVRARPSQWRARTHGGEKVSGKPPAELRQGSAQRHLRARRRSRHCSGFRSSGVAGTQAAARMGNQIARTRAAPASVACQCRCVRPPAPPPRAGPALVGMDAHRRAPVLGKCAVRDLARRARHRRGACRSTVCRVALGGRVGLAATLSTCVRARACAAGLAGACAAPGSACASQRRRGGARCDARVACRRLARLALQPVCLLCCWCLRCICGCWRWARAARPEPQARAWPSAMIALGVLPLLLLAFVYARELGLGVGGLAESAVLALAGGQVGPSAAVVECRARLSVRGPCCSPRRRGIARPGRRWVA